MDFVDFVLNCGALLLWLNFSSRGWGKSRPASIALVATLRRAEPARHERWRSPAILLAVLLLRALCYWQIGPGLGWTPGLSLVAMTIPFRSDNLVRMLLFSLLSFLAFGAVFYFCLLLIAAVNRKLPANDTWQGYVRVLLGFLERLPVWGKLLLPFVGAVLFWIACGRWLSAIGVHVPVRSWSHRLQEAALVGIGAWTMWKYIIVAVLVLHVVSSHVYLGNAPLWLFINVTARNLMGPLSWLPLRFGRFDFAPIVALGLVFMAAEMLQRWLPELYTKLPIF